MAKFLSRVIYAGPNQIKQLLVKLKRMKNMYTDKNETYVDFKGNKYSGYIKNDGDELLFENRLVKMRKPSLKLLRMNDSIKRFFDVKYSDLSESYLQQNMIEFRFKNDNALFGDSYTIYFFINFPKPETLVVNRASYDNSDIIQPMIFHKAIPHQYNNIIQYATIVHQNAPSTYSGTIIFGNQTIDNMKDDLYVLAGTYNVDASGSGTTAKAMFSSNSQSYSTYGRPLFYCVNRDFEYMTKNLPLISGNNKYMEIGVDGHDRHYLKPINLNDNENDYYIMIYSKTDSITEDNIIGSGSYGRSVYIIKNPKGNKHFNSENTIITSIDMSESDVRIIKPDLKDGKTIIGGRSWEVYTPIEGDKFYSNYRANEGKPQLSVALFKIHDPENLWSVSEYSEYIILSPYILEYKFDRNLENAFHHNTVDDGNYNGIYNGIHMAVNNEDNDIDKYHGVVHELQDCKGLPEYYYDLNDMWLSNSRCEVFHITNTDSKYEGISSLLCDSGYTASEFVPITDIPRNIYYDEESNEFAFDESIIVIDNMNYGTDNMYVPDEDGLIIAVDTIEEYKDNKRFIYHNNSSFSLGIVFIKEKYIGRVYYLSNDDCEYVNNTKADVSNKKHGTELARICDIPTSFKQLDYEPATVYIVNIGSDTLPSDFNVYHKEYTKTYCSYTVEDQDRLRMIPIVRYNEDIVDSIEDNPIEFFNIKVYGTDNIAIEYTSSEGVIRHTEKQQIIGNTFSETAYDYTKTSMDDSYVSYVLKPDMIHGTSDFYMMTSQSSDLAPTNGDAKLLKEYIESHGYNVNNSLYSVYSSDGKTYANYYILNMFMKDTESPYYYNGELAYAALKTPSYCDLNLYNILLNNTTLSYSFFDDRQPIVYYMNYNKKLYSSTLNLVSNTEYLYNPVDYTASCIEVTDHGFGNRSGKLNYHLFEFSPVNYNDELKEYYDKLNTMDRDSLINEYISTCGIKNHFFKNISDKTDEAIISKIKLNMQMKTINKKPSNSKLIGDAASGTKLADIPLHDGSDIISSMSYDTLCYLYNKQKKDGVAKSKEILYSFELTIPYIVGPGYSYIYNIEKILNGEVTVNNKTIIGNPKPFKIYMNGNDVSEYSILFIKRTNGKNGELVNIEMCIYDKSSGWKEMLSTADKEV